MSLVTRERPSGLVVAEQASDEARIGHALKQIDPRLALQRNGPFYQVVCITGWDRPDQVQTVFTWMDAHGNPLPLSSGLVEEFKALRPEAGDRHGRVDVEQHNQRIEDETVKLMREDGEGVVDEHRAKIERGRVTVSLGPQARSRHWQRNHQLPAWLRSH